jgi:hypothetical protein
MAVRGIVSHSQTHSRCSHNGLLYSLVLELLAGHIVLITSVRVLWWQRSSSNLPCQKVLNLGFWVWYHPTPEGLHKRPCPEEVTSEPLSADPTTLDTTISWATVGQSGSAWFYPVELSSTPGKASLVGKLASQHLTRLTWKASCWGLGCFL